MNNNFYKSRTGYLQSDMHEGRYKGVQQAFKLITYQSNPTKL